MLTYEEAMVILQPLIDAGNPAVSDFDLSVHSKEEISKKALEVSALGQVNETNPIAEDLQSIQNAGDMMDDMSNGIIPPIAASSKSFNLKKIAQFDPMQDPMADPFADPMQDPSQDPMADPMADPMGQEMEADPFADPFAESQPEDSAPRFSSHADLKDFLDQFEDLVSLQSQNPELPESITKDENATDALDRYYQESNDEIRARYADIIYKGLPTIMQNKEEGETPFKGEAVPVVKEKVGSMYSDYLNKITASIEKAAKEAASQKKKASKTFNMKTAQHHSDQNVIMWGPGQTRIDPFYRQPVSDWHIMERNKGFGQDIDGVWDIDWEAVWRGNVMDKYSRPYRDTKTGEWVGGYIQKRFEVDKWIPETNNMQLLPGERRKPILPEYGSTESRLQAMRNKNDGNLGREFNDTSKPFNWREAQSKKMTKTAQFGDEGVDLVEQYAEGIFSNMDAPGDISQLFQYVDQKMQSVGSPELTDQVFRRVLQMESEPVDTSTEDWGDLHDNIQPSMVAASTKESQVTPEKRQFVLDLLERGLAEEENNMLGEEPNSLHETSDPSVIARAAARKTVKRLSAYVNDVDALAKAIKVSQMAVTPQVQQKLPEALQRLMQQDKTNDFVNSYQADDWDQVLETMGDLNTDDMKTDEQVADLINLTLTGKNEKGQQAVPGQTLPVPGMQAAAQTDVSTQKQLDNAAGKSSIQRHEGEGAEESDGSDYRDNYGDEIKDKSASVKKKALTR